MINVECRTNPTVIINKREFHLFNIIADGENTFLIVRSDEDPDVNKVFKLHLRIYHPYFELKEVYPEVDYKYDENFEHWRVISSSDRVRDDEVTRTVVYKKPISERRAHIGEYYYLIKEDNRVGAHVSHFNDNKQEDGFVTYLNSWFTLPTPDGYFDWFSLSKELDKRLASVHLSTGKQLRLKGIGMPRLVGEEAGELDDKSLSEHFEMILSSI